MAQKQPVVEQLIRDGLLIQPFTTTNASKAQAMEALQLAFEGGHPHIERSYWLVNWWHTKANDFRPDSRDTRLPAPRHSGEPLVALRHE